MLTWLVFAALPPSSLAFVFSANPLIVAWQSANVSGNTKKSSMYTAFNAFSAVGNIIAPQLFKAKDAPSYRPGLQATLAFFCVLELAIALQVLNLFRLNRQKENQRERNGKPRKLHDLSMENKFNNAEVLDTKLGRNILLDQTDTENDEFVYVY